MQTRAVLVQVVKDIEPEFERPIGKLELSSIEAERTARFRVPSTTSPLTAQHHGASVYPKGEGLSQRIAKRFLQATGNPPGSFELSSQNTLALDKQPTRSLTCEPQKLPAGKPLPGVLNPDRLHHSPSDTLALPAWKSRKPTEEWPVNDSRLSACVVLAPWVSYV